MNGNLFLLSRSHLTRPVHFPLLPGSIVVGRSSVCDLVVSHESVSRRHAALHVLNGRVTVIDLNSLNGTFINDQRIEEAALEAGAKVTFGGTLFVLILENPEGNVPDSDVQTIDHRGPGQTAIPDTISVQLSPTQRSVMIYLVDGLTEKQTAERLTVSRHTVHTHVREIYRILKVHSRAELLALLLKF